MRRTIEHLAWEIQDAPPTITIGELARQFGEATERITDAIDVLKIRARQPTQYPVVDWHRRPPNLWVVLKPRADATGPTSTGQPLTIQTSIDHGMWPPQ